MLVPVNPDSPNLDQSLRQLLEQVEDSADLIRRGIGYFDPDDMASELTDEADGLRDVLARLMAEPDVGTHSGELMLTGTPSDELNAIVRRFLHVGATHAGAEGVFEVRRQTVDGTPALELLARPPEDSKRTPRPPQDRCQSLVEFVSDLGGELTLSVGEGHELTAVLRLPDS